MNNLMLLLVALVALCYYGGKYCPAVLRQNKEMLLGGLIALVLCSFFGMNLEGMTRMTGMTGMAGMDLLPEIPGGQAAQAAAARDRERLRKAQYTTCINGGGQNC
jgi:hypothetical protein